MVQAGEILIDGIDVRRMDLEELRQLTSVVLQDVFLVGFVASLLALAAAFMVPRGSARQHARRE